MTFTKRAKVARDSVFGHFLHNLKDVKIYKRTRLSPFSKMSHDFQRQLLNHIDFFFQHQNREYLDLRQLYREAHRARHWLHPLIQIKSAGIGLSVVAFILTRKLPIDPYLKKSRRLCLIVSIMSSYLAVEVLGKRIEPFVARCDQYAYLCCANIRIKCLIRCIVKQHFGFLSKWSMYQSSCFLCSYDNVYFLHRIQLQICFKRNMPIILQTRFCDNCNFSECYHIGISICSLCVFHECHRALLRRIERKLKRRDRRNRRFNLIMSLFIQRLLRRRLNAHNSTCVANDLVPHIMQFLVRKPQYICRFTFDQIPSLLAPQRIDDFGQYFRTRNKKCII